MEADTIGYWLGLIGIGAITSSIISNWYSHRLEQRKFKREQEIAYLRERLDNFYSPMIFHFENMRSWSVFWGKKSYAFAIESLAQKIGNMNELMRLGMRLGDSKVQKLWYDWQPFAVAAVERGRGRNIYPQFNAKEFLSRSKRLHEALIAERNRLMARYRHAVGEDSHSPPVSIIEENQEKSEREIRTAELFYASVLGAIYGFSFSLIVPNMPPVLLTQYSLLNQVIGWLFGVLVFLMITLLTIHWSVKFLRYAFRGWFGKIGFQWRWPPVNFTLAEED